MDRTGHLGRRLTTVLTDGGERKGESGGREREMYNHQNTEQEGTMRPQNHILYMTCESHISKSDKADIHVHVHIIKSL